MKSLIQHIQESFKIGCNKMMNNKIAIDEIGSKNFINKLSDKKVTYKDEALFKEYFWTYLNIEFKDDYKGWLTEEEFKEFSNTNPFDFCKDEEIKDNISGYKLFNIMCDGSMTFADVYKRLRNYYVFNPEDVKIFIKLNN